MLGQKLRLGGAESYGAWIGNRKVIEGSKNAKGGKKRGGAENRSVQNPKGRKGFIV